MTQETLVQRRDRTHAIVEGALLGDIAIVFLLMRVYLPILVVRTLLRSVAAVPFVLLLQRRGLKITVLAAFASYILFSALVGPLLALTAIDVAVAGILVGLGRRMGLNAGLNTLWTGPAYAFLDLILPTIATVLIFRYPVKDLITSAQHFVSAVFNLLIWVMARFGASPALLHQMGEWERVLRAHWQWAWIGSFVLYGTLTMYLVVLITEMVLRQMPNETLERRKAA